MPNTIKNKSLNILLWILQILLAFYFVAGGVYLPGHYKMLATPWALNVLPQPFWMILGILQVLFAIGLVAPAVIKIFPKLISISAVGLAVISLFGIVLYDAYMGSGMLWAILPAVVLAGVAYGRGK